MNYLQKIQSIVRVNRLYALKESDLWDILDFSSAVILEGHFELLCGEHSEHFFRFAAISQYPSFVAKISKELVAWVKQEDDLPSVDVVLGPTSQGMLFAYDMARELNGQARSGATRAVYATIDKEGRPQKQLAKGFEIKPGEEVLIVNDMTTTGKGLQTLVELVNDKGANVAGIGLFANRGIVEDKIVKLQEKYTTRFNSILELNMPSWDASDCRLCREGEVPAIKSGDLNHLPIYQDKNSFPLYLKKLANKAA